MKVFIYAYEDKYGGLHGIYDQTVVEVADMKEANMIGNDMSWGVIDSWGLSQDYDEDYEDEEFEVEYGTEWIIYKIRDDVTLSIGGGIGRIMAKGAAEKELVTQKILEIFENSFVYGKEIRVPVNDVQIKVTLTCAKENVSAGADNAIPGAAPTVTNAFDTVAEKVEVHATEEEVKLVNSLIDKLGL